MTEQSHGNLAVHEWTKAERERASAITVENQVRDERLDDLETTVEQLKAEQQTLREVVRALARKLG